jgi:hypothetical protein
VKRHHVVLTWLVIATTVLLLVELIYLGIQLVT